MNFFEVLETLDSDVVYMNFNDVYIETGKENFGNSFGYILVSLLLGGVFAGVSHIFVKSYIRDELGRNLAKVRPITKAELEMLKKMIVLKQQNLSLLTDTGNNNENNAIQYSLRK